MASSKDIRNLIITLIILAAGIWILIRIARAYIGAIPSAFSEIGNSLEGMGTLITLGIAFLVVILVIVYFAKRSDEKKKQMQPQPRQPYPKQYS